MLKIYKEQLAEMERRSEVEYVGDLARHLRAEHGEAVAGLDDAELERRIRIGVARAEYYGMDADAAIFGFVAMMFEVAPTFDRQPAIRRVLRDDSIPPDLRIDALWDRTTDEDWDEAERLGQEAEAFWAGSPGEGASSPPR